MTELSPSIAPTDDAAQGPDRDGTRDDPHTPQAEANVNLASDISPNQTAVPEQDNVHTTVQVHENLLAEPQQAPSASEITQLYQRGQQDPTGCPITDIYWATRKVVIYEAANQIRYILPDRYDVAKDLRRKITGLGGLRASVDDLRSDPSISPNERSRAAREISWALAAAFEDETIPPSAEPKEVLTRVDARLRASVKSNYRKKYALSNLFAFLAIEAVLLGLIWLFGFKLDHVMARYATYGAFGALGAFLSVITGIKSIDFDINLKNWEHIFAGATRILIGVIGALVIALALDSHLVDPTFGFHSAASGDPADQSSAASSLGGSVDRTMAMYLIFAFIAGFSESLVPNLLRKGEQATGSTESATTPDGPIVKDMKP